MRLSQPAGATLSIGPRVEVPPRETILRHTRSWKLAGSDENRPPLPRTPFTPRAGRPPGHGRLPPSPPARTLPHPLENASRFPQPVGHDDDYQTEDRLESTTEGGLISTPNRSP